MSYYEYDVRKHSTRQICEGCEYFQEDYLDCSNCKESYRDYITKCCKFYKPRRYYGNKSKS